MSDSDCIVAEGLTRIFGQHQSRALSLLERGIPVAEIRASTGATPAVIDASFSVREGEIFVVMGLSGSGKSTLVRMINGLILPSSGKLEVRGRDVSRMTQAGLVRLRREAVSMVFQSFALLPHLSVRENVAFGLKIAGMSNRERSDRAEETLAHVGLEGYGDSLPDELSGGMQQRVGLARALAVDPEILLMDEAFSALDPLIRTEMQDDLLALQRQESRTIVFISHDLEEAFRLGDRIAVLQSGRLAQVGTPRQILMHPANEYIRAFFRNVDVTQVYTAGQVAHWPAAVMAERPGFGVHNALEILDRHGVDYGVIVDRAGKLRGLVDRAELTVAAGAGHESPLSSACLDVPVVQADVVLRTLLGRVAGSRLPVPVVTTDGRFIGLLGKEELLQTLDSETRQECAA